MSEPADACRIEFRAGALTAQVVADVVGLARRAEEHDGVAALSEASRIALTADAVNGPTAVHLLAYDQHDPAALLGYAQAPPLLGTGDAAGLGDGELVVAPESRGRGVGGQLLDSLLDAGATGVWAHGELRAAGRLARRRGMPVARTLLQLGRSLADPVAVPPIPAGFRLRPYEGPGDWPELLRVNAAAFVGLPDQGGWTLEDLVARVTADWFDPAGLLLAWEAGGAQLAGFHWTKSQSTDLGEVYVIAVDPADQGHGLGGVLLAVGLEHLRATGHTRVMLFVDAANTSASRIYERAGFTRLRRDVVFAAPTPGSTGEAAGASTPDQPLPSGRLET